MKAYIGLAVVSVLLVFWLLRKKRRLVVSAIRIFPIKSCGEIRLDSVKMNSTGFLYDREWMIVDENNQMVTQRDDSRLLRLNPKLNLRGDQLLSLDLEYQGSTFKLVSNPSQQIFKLSCQKVDCEGSDEGEEVRQFLFKSFGKNYKLMRIHKHKQVNHDKNFAGLIPDDFKANFTDASQCLVVSTASFAKVKSWVPDHFRKDFVIDCFRGNIVVDGCREFEEETWSKFSIGTVEFMGLAKCPRCKVTTVNQGTLEYSENFEPVNTLRKMNGNGVKGYFGMYCLRLSDGELRVGQEVIVKETRKFPDI